MEFPELLNKNTTQVYASWEAANLLSEEERKKKFSRAVKLDAKYVDSLRKELRSGDIKWYSDAPKLVGGKGEYAGALLHFLSGLPLCQMTHYAERASVWGLKLERLEMSVSGHFTGISGYGFDKIEYETRIVSPENPEKIKELVKAAEYDCYVTNTLKRACTVKGHIFLNGEALMDT